MITLCTRCGKNPAKYSIDDQEVCEKCYGEYDNCVNCGALIHESVGYPVMNGEEVGYGWKGSFKLRCSVCHGGI